MIRKIFFSTPVIIFVSAAIIIDLLIGFSIAGMAYLLFTGILCGLLYVFIREILSIKSILFGNYNTIGSMLSGLNKSFRIKKFNVGTMDNSQEEIEKMIETFKSELNKQPKIKE